MTVARFGSRLLLLVVVCLFCLSLPLGAAAGPAPDGPVISLSGQFVFLWGDPGPAAVAAGTPQPWLATAGGSIPLRLTGGLALPPGGLLALNRRPVNVQGWWLGAPGPGTALQVEAIALVLPEPAGGPEGLVGSQPWVSVLCKFKDIVAEPKNLAYFQGMYANAFPGLDHYWRQVSYNNIDLVGSAAVGWYTLPQPRSYYVYDNDGDGDVELDWGRAADDCTGVADPDVYYPQYVGINLMFNADLDCCAWGGSWYVNRDGQNKLYRMTWEPPWGYGNIGVISHETGHGFGLPHSSGDYGQVYDNRWDVMSDIWTDCGNLTDPTYGCVGQGTISYHLDLEGWVVAGRKATVNRGSRTTLTLERLHLPPGGNYLLAQIPIEGSPTWFYTVEARRKVGYDLKLPAQGVILHEVDTSRNEPAHVVDVDGDGNTGDAYFSVGQSFTDAANGVVVSVDAATATGYTVTISNRYVPPVHVRSIALRYQAKNGLYLVKAGVRIVDASHAPVAGATVSAEWTLPDGSKLDADATTNATGQAVFKTKSGLVGSYGLCVTAVSKAGMVYDPGQNHVTCRELPVP